MGVGDAFKALGRGIKHAAPTLANVLINAAPGGPLVKAAAGAVAAAVGSDSDDPDVLLKQIAVSDPAQAAAMRTADQQFELEVRRIDLQRDLAQIDVNKTAAQSKSLFVAGGRPAGLWICNAALAYAFLFYPMLGGAARVYLGFDMLPVDDERLFYLLGGLLGLGGFRSWDKRNGVAREQ